MPVSLFQRFELNTRGRDFIVGDLHGRASLFRAALKQAGFQPEVDRVFSVGDLGDRGPESLAAVALLRETWFHSVHSNHHEMLTEIYEDGLPDPAIEEFVFSHNGMRWLLSLNLEVRLEIVERFRALPIAIEVETRRGLVGIVHAGVPRGMDWSEFTDLLQKGGSPKVIQHALWDRSRIDNGLATDVEGVGRVFVGHTIVPQAGRLGNVYYLDTGAYASSLFSENSAHLTLADMTCATQVFPELRHDHGFTDNAAAAASLAVCALQPAAEIPNPGQIRVMADAQPSKKPFSHYLMSRRPAR